MTRFNPQFIHGHLSYTIRELARAFGINEKTCLRWIDEGLKIVPGSNKPILIMGKDIQECIRARNSKKKVKLKRHEFYCFKCKAPRRAKRGTITRSGDTKKGDCCVCNGKMTRKIKPYQKDYYIPSNPVQMSTLFDNLT
jgi:transposase-like protein